MAAMTCKHTYDPRKRVSLSTNPHNSRTAADSVAPFVTFNGTIP